MICVRCNGRGQVSKGMGHWDICFFCEGSGRASNPFREPTDVERKHTEFLRARNLNEPIDPCLHEPKKGEHVLDTRWVVNNEDWPSGEGEYMVPCPGCEKCEKDRG